MTKKHILILASLLSVMAVTHAFAAPAHTVKHRVHHEQAASTAPVDLNTADAKTLGELKGIGPKKAEAIVEYRKQHGNFASLDGLASIKGFSKKVVARLVKNNPNRLIVKP